MKSNLPRLMNAIFSTPWAIAEDRLEAIVEVVERRASGVFLSGEEIAAVKGDRIHNGMIETHAIEADGTILAARSQSQSQPSSNVIAVINVMGIIAQHASQVDNISGPGGTSTERLSAAFRSAMADPSVSAIVFNIDSPGGSVSGVQALADEIFAARGQKPIVAQCNSLMASAAYWIGAAADEIVMTPGAQAGSIGVYSMHKDMSAAAEQEGMKITFIKAGLYKTEGNPFEPLGSEATAALQKTVDAYYSDFTKGVAKFRGVKAEDVRNGFGQGRVEKDTFAVSAGMADRVATLDQTLNRLGKSAKSSKTNVAEIEPETIAETLEPTVEITEPESEKPNSDEFRRRRHAHRMRALKA
jgi:capsid assembly protease